jgi:S-DNA-T family DNA segregation ATPase FtsK/SpoIIIE
MVKKEKNKPKEKEISTKALLSSPRIREIIGVFFTFLSIFFFLSLYFYNAEDVCVFPQTEIKNCFGWLGAYTSYYTYIAIGKAGYFLPFLIFLWAIAMFRGKSIHRVYTRVIGIILILISSSIFLSLSKIVPPIDGMEPSMTGGIIGKLLVGNMVEPGPFIRFFGEKWGAYTTLSFIFLVGILLSTEILIMPTLRVIFKGIKLIGLLFLKFFRGIWRGTRLFWLNIRERWERKAVKKRAILPERPPRITSPLLKILKKKPETPIKSSQPVKEIPKEKEEDFDFSDTQAYQLPPLSLLKTPIEDKEDDDADIEAKAKILEATLKEFGVEAKIINTNKGPAVTSFELEPAPGVKVNKITALSDDIALALRAQSVRIVAPIPGKAAVGIEIPRKRQQLVFLKELLEGRGPEHQSKLLLCLGKDILGQPLFTDLAVMPHLLIAGTTGSGKTVCVNALISGMLFNTTPDELRFVMIDPKMVELASFGGIPHLAMPVITNAKKASLALKWLTREMDKRYEVLAKVGVRNIDAYNNMDKAIRKEKEAVNETEKPIKVFRTSPDIMPYIVVIIDELADLMLVAQDTVEESITRLAQLSRAVGLHLIIATQRPSVDVLTGIIKANLPYRISFQVSSKIDSRTVLDMNGADKLLGQGDMLFLPSGRSKPIRAQGVLVSDKSIERITNFWRRQKKSTLLRIGINPEEEINKIGTSADDDERDEIYKEAVKIIMESKYPSVSMLQRRLRIGYNRAARLVELMEGDGIVSPPQGPNKVRKLLTKDNVEME